MSRPRAGELENDPRFGRNVTTLDFSLQRNSFPPQKRFFHSDRQKRQIDEWKQSLGWVQSFKIAFLSFL